MSSPAGRQSKRSKVAAQKRLSAALFGPEGLQQPQVVQPGKKEALLRRAKELRELAARGMKPRAYVKEAEKLEAEAAGL